ncbi:MAG: hypothetical protein IJ959_02635, partial [Clostridia bacterium]|nr:hypothetical protein [Clostridia bacterium]
VYTSTSSGISQAVISPVKSVYYGGGFHASGPATAAAYVANCVSSDGVVVDRLIVADLILTINEPGSHSNYGGTKAYHFRLSYSATNYSTVIAYRPAFVLQL